MALRPRLTHGIHSGENTWTRERRGSSTIGTRGEPKPVRLLNTSAWGQHMGIPTHVLLVKASHMTSPQSRAARCTPPAMELAGGVYAGKGKGLKRINQTATRRGKTYPWCKDMRTLSEREREKGALFLVLLSSAQQVILFDGAFDKTHFLCNHPARPTQ